MDTIQKHRELIKEYKKIFFKLQKGGLLTWEDKVIRISHRDTYYEYISLEKLGVIFKFTNEVGIGVYINDVQVGTLRGLCVQFAKMRIINKINNAKITSKVDCKNLQLEEKLKPLKILTDD